MLSRAGTLDVFVNDRCDMACRSCCVAVNRGPAHRLDWPTLRAALELFLDKVLADGQKTVLFAGGEPLLDADLVCEGARFVRGGAAARRVKAEVLVYTNGAALTPELFARLRAAGARVVVSLDGGPRTNDRYRRFAAAGRGSAYAAVRARLDALPKEGLGLNVVMRPDGLAHLLDEVAAFHEAGFESIDLWIDYFAEWDEAALVALARFFDGLRRYYAGRCRDRVPFDIPMLRHAVLNARAKAKGLPWWGECGKLVLGADGHFYACEGSLAVPYGGAAAGRVGTPAAGVDWRARARAQGRLNAALRPHGARARWQHVCPRVYARVSELDGAPLGPRLANLHRVSEVYCSGLMSLVGALRSNAAFRAVYL